MYKILLPDQLRILWRKHTSQDVLKMPDPPLATELTLTEPPHSPAKSPLTSIQSYSLQS